MFGWGEAVFIRGSIPPCQIYIFTTRQREIGMRRSVVAAVVDRGRQF